jgi:hypothetical protein
LWVLHVFLQSRRVGFRLLENTLHDRVLQDLCNLDLGSGG